MLFPFLIISPAQALDEPCYGFGSANRVSGEHFWVEWEDEVATEDIALDRLEYAEAAREFFVNQGWRITDEPVLISIIDSSSSYGLTQTQSCDDTPVPFIVLASVMEDGGYEVPGLGTTTHEVAHVVQFAYMGDHRDSLASWTWFMEAAATAMAFEVDEDAERWAVKCQGFLDEPQLALHQDLTAMVFEDRKRHLYGTGVFVRFMQLNYGGAETQQQLWEYGEQHSGELIWFPDAVEAVGLDFPGLWLHYMVASTVLDISDSETLVAPRAHVQDSIPGTLDIEAELGPQGLGLGYTRFPVELGEPGRALQVHFDGDSSVEWQVVLVRTVGHESGGTVLDYTALQVEGGSGSGWISGYDGTATGFLVASPLSDSREGLGYSTTIELIRDDGPMPDRVVWVDQPAVGGCGCSAGLPPQALWSGLLLALVAVRRSRRA